MKLWKKDAVPDPRVIEFTSAGDRTADLRLAEWDIAGSMAHAIMLGKTGLITTAEKDELLRGLTTLYSKAVKGELLIEDGVEDIHSQVEKELTDLIGDTGKKIHTGRSRNDQVLVDLRLWTRNAIDSLAADIERLFNKLQELSEQHKDKLIPGYTHMQPAMVSSFGLWFGSWAESLADDLLILGSARAVVDRNPLGTGAGYGTSLPLDRKLTTELLDFGGLLYNSAYASLSRGKAELAVASAIASAAQTLARFSAEVCLFMTAEFRFIDFPDEFITGSSIMPQKRNPDAFELIRGRTHILQLLPGQVSMLVTGLPSGYNRDLQLLKSLIFNAFSELGECIDMAVVMLENIKINDNIAGNPLYNPIYSTEEANRLVKEGVPFRDAYKAVSSMIGKKVFEVTALSEYVHEGSIGNLCNDEVKTLFRERMKCFSSSQSGELIAGMLKKK
jgi:argininosuccinate lyase